MYEKRLYVKFDSDLKNSCDILRARIGPLLYQFQAHDDWGMSILNHIRDNCLCVDFLGESDRVFHLARLAMTEDENRVINQNCLPERFYCLLPEESPPQDWNLGGDETGFLTFWHEKTRHCLWIFGAIPELFKAPFQLPWRLVLADIIKKEGGIMHGGLVARNGKGLILTAPPGGGKTTAISRLPDSWKALSDDACLVWPEGDNMYFASPLPTWSVLLGKNATLHNINRWEIGTIVALSGMIFIIKGDQEFIRQLPKLEGITKINQALCEHPQVVGNRDLHRVHFFDTARRLSKYVPNFILQVTRDGQLWELIFSSVKF